MNDQDPTDEIQEARFLVKILTERVDELEKAARKAALFKSYQKHSIYCYNETEDSCDCGLSDLRAVLGVKHVR